MTARKSQLGEMNPISKVGKLIPVVVDAQSCFKYFDNGFVS